MTIKQRILRAIEGTPYDPFNMDHGPDPTTMVESEAVEWARDVAIELRTAFERSPEWADSPMRTLTMELEMIIYDASH